MIAFVTSRSFGKCSPQAVEFLEKSGIEIRWFSGLSVTPEAISEQIGAADVLIVGNDIVNRSVMESARQLKLIHMHGTGLDGIDIAAANELGILVGNAPGANKNAVAELTVALLLSVGRHIQSHSDSLRAGRWERIAGNELFGKTLGVVGLGNIGRAVVELLVGFRLNVIAYEPAPVHDWVHAHGVRLSKTVEDVFSEADFLAICAPHNSLTENLVNAQRLRLMKPTAYLVNTSRGALIDEDALVRAIDEGWIAGAALDAFRKEPLPLESPLRRKGISLTPHLAATSQESSATVSNIVAQNVVEILLHGDVGRAANSAECNRLRMKQG